MNKEYGIVAMEAYKKCFQTKEYEGADDETVIGDLIADLYHVLDDPDKIEDVTNMAQVHYNEESGT